MLILRLPAEVGESNCYVIPERHGMPRMKPYLESLLLSISEALKTSDSCFPGLRKYSTVPFPVPPLCRCSTSPPFKRLGSLANPPGKTKSSRLGRMQDVSQIGQLGGVLGVDHLSAHTRTGHLIACRISRGWTISSQSICARVSMVVICPQR